MTVVKTVDKVNTIEFQQIDRIHKFKVFIYNLSNQLQIIRFDGSVTVLIRLHHSRSCQCSEALAR